MLTAGVPQYLEHDGNPALEVEVGFRDRSHGLTFFESSLACPKHSKPRRDAEGLLAAGKEHIDAPIGPGFRAASRRYGVHDEEDIGMLFLQHVADSFDRGNDACRRVNVRYG